MRGVFARLRGSASALTFSRVGIIWLTGLALGFLCLRPPWRIDATVISGQGGLSQSIEVGRDWLWATRAQLMARLPPDAWPGVSRFGSPRVDTGLLGVECSLAFIAGGLAFATTCLILRGSTVRSSRSRDDAVGTIEIPGTRLSR